MMPRAGSTAHRSADVFRHIGGRRACPTPADGTSGRVGAPRSLCSLPCRVSDARGSASVCSSPAQVRSRGVVSGNTETWTVLFTDLVESTDLRIRIGEPAFDRFRQRHDQLLRACIVGHLGDVVKLRMTVSWLRSVRQRMPSRRRSRSSSGSSAGSTPTQMRPRRRFASGSASVTPNGATAISMALSLSKPLGCAPPPSRAGSCVPSWSIRCRHVAATAASSHEVSSR